MSFYFARIQYSPRTGRRILGVAVMKQTDYGAIFITQKPDLEAAMAEVRRLNERTAS